MTPILRPVYRPFVTLKMRGYSPKLKFSLRVTQPQLSLDSVKNPEITVAQKCPDVASTVRKFASTN